MTRERGMVGVRGFEPPWVAPPDPKSGASANSATRPNLLFKNRTVSPDSFAVKTAISKCYPDYTTNIYSNAKNYSIQKSHRLMR